MRRKRCCSMGCAADRVELSENRPVASAQWRAPRPHLMSYKKSLVGHENAVYKVTGFRRARRRIVQGDS